MVRYTSVAKKPEPKKPRASSKRSTAAECDFRQQAVYGLILDGHSNSQIWHFAADAWGVSQRQTERYIAEARKLIEKDCDIARTSYLAEVLARLRNYEQQAAKRGQLQVATNSVRLQAELVGLTAK